MPRQRERRRRARRWRRHSGSLQPSGGTSGRTLDAENNTACGGEKLQPTPPIGRGLLVPHLHAGSMPGRNAGPKAQPPRGRVGRQSLTCTPVPCQFCISPPPAQPSCGWACSPRRAESPPAPHSVDSLRLRQFDANWHRLRKRTQVQEQGGPGQRDTLHGAAPRRAWAPRQELLRGRAGSWPENGARRRRSRRGRDGTKKRLDFGTVL